MELLGNHSLSENQEKNNISGHALLAGNICLMSTSTKQWLLDSSATDHIFPDLQEFESFQTVTNSEDSITVPDGRKIKVLHIGKVKLNDKIVLQQVLHVLDFQYKLIYVHKLCWGLH